MLFNSIDFLIFFPIVVVFYNVPAFEVLLPVGISFYTFQTLAYTIDVYRGKLKPEKHLGIFALYVAFFPQLVAGPIERAKNLLPQFYHKFNFSGNRVVSGLRLMLWGMFKKVVIADRLAIYVNEVYNNPSEYHGLPIIIATFFFAFQIYCDFSGYSDIAIGSARIMGYNIMTNFRQPYFSQSVAEFWQRWHISLSTWFRDYLYIPLGGNRVPKWRWYLNLMIVFVVSGLWHGANWTFIIWGALHGSYLLIEIWMKNIRAKISDLRYLERFSSGQTLLRTLTTFLLIVFAWMFFRAASIGEAFILIQNMFYINGFAGINVPWVLHVANPRFEMALSLGLLAFLQGIHFLQNCNLLKPMFYSQPRTVRWASYLLLALAIMNFGISEEIPFIYFQF
ncbi:MAG: hypothetical protein B6242_17355 [Anaerolineaceae bacterium 4572_78]|nr:MAG: hypothetical protein B6242_17355 [Anaerolineaceae bacterium 4572_78]